MITALRLLYIVVLVTMLIVTTAASLKENILQINPVALQDPWFWATMFDAYFGFFTFYLWVAYRANSNLARFIWFIAIMVLGNIAMATYMLNLLFRLPKNADIADVLLKPKDKVVSS